MLEEEKFAKLPKGFAIVVVSAKSKLVLDDPPTDSEISNRITSLSKKNGDRDHHLIELFQVVIGYDEDNKFFFAQVYCVPDNKGFTPASNNLGILLKNIRFELLKKYAQLTAPKIIVPDKEIIRP